MAGDAGTGAGGAGPAGRAMSSSALACVIGDVLLRVEPIGVDELLSPNGLGAAATTTTRLDGDTLVLPESSEACSVYAATGSSYEGSSFGVRNAYVQ